MKRVLTILFAIMLVGQVWALGGPKKMASMSNQVICEIESYYRMQNGDVFVKMSVTFPPKYFQKAAIMELSPVLKYEGGEKIFNSQTIQGESVQANNEICSYSNGGTFFFRFNIPFEERIHWSDLFLRAKISAGKKEQIYSNIKVNYSNKLVPYLAKYNNNRVIIDYDNEGKVIIIVCDVSGKKGNRFETVIDSEDPRIKLIRDNNVRDVFLKGFNGNVFTIDSSYTFVGEVALNTKSGEIEEQEGRRDYNKGQYRTVRIFKGDKCGVEIDYPYGNEISKASMFFKNDEFSKIQWWSIDDYIENANEIELTYSGGDSFKGTATYANGRIEPKSGVFKYRSGDKFTGNVTSKAAGGIFVDGTTTFFDNISVSGNWLSEYQLTADQLNEISKMKTPISKRRYAEYKQEEKREQTEWRQKEEEFIGYMNNGDKAFNAKKYEDAKRWYEQAFKLKPSGGNDDKNLKEKIDYVNKIVEKERNKKRLIAKYGQDKGTKLAKGILEIGMTKQMAEEVIIDQSVYRTSASYDYNGNTIETWEYDPNKLPQEPIDGAELLARAFLLDEFGSMYEEYLKDQNRQKQSKVKYKYVKFKNNKVVELRDHNSYEDSGNSIDDVIDDILLWEFLSD